ncbi:hypothetical protein F4859DRAFT_511198 [Xylaria cf. heliscus]|nr:hypothetical protein F4859DRAFT_511198 [Xylaria cf. heliscus]
MTTLTRENVTLHQVGYATSYGNSSRPQRAGIQGKPSQQMAYHGATLSKYNMKPTALLATSILALAPLASAGPAAYGICQAGCAGVVMACYGAAGFTWGATAGLTLPASVIACNTTFGACQAACWAAAIAPTP